MSKMAHDINSIMSHHNINEQNDTQYNDTQHNATWHDCKNFEKPQKGITECRNCANYVSYLCRYTKCQLDISGCLRQLFSCIDV
jgi:hypothetical protein